MIENVVRTILARLFPPKLGRIRLASIDGYARLQLIRDGVIRVYGAEEFVDVPPPRVWEWNAGRWWPRKPGER